MHELRPAILFAQELSLARSRQPVILRTLVRFAHTPFGFEPPVFLQPVQGRIKRAGLHLQEIVGLRANCLSDAVPVLGSPLQGPQDEHVEGALQELEAAFVSFGHSRRQSTTLDVDRLRRVPTDEIDDFRNIHRKSGQLAARTGNSHQMVAPMIGSTATKAKAVENCCWSNSRPQIGSVNATAAENDDDAMPATMLRWSCG